jgi:glucosamine--fructose-6-phosphate aminotransferase (isomerizing)
MENLSSNGKHTYAEIMSQGDTWRKTIEDSSRQLDTIKDWLAFPHEEIIFAGCGSTHYLSLSAAKTWTYLMGESARGIPSSEIWYYPSVTFSKLKPSLVAISRSGETTETINALRVFRDRYQEEGLVIGCYPESTMARSSQFPLMAPNAQETSIAQTRSFSSMYILSQLLAATAAKNAEFLKELAQLPDIFGRVIFKNEELVKRIGVDSKYQHFVFLGSGVNFGLASEAMLKMKEMSTSNSEVFSFMEFRHGPMSVISDQSLVIGFVSDTRKKDELQVLQEMKKLGAHTLALVEDATAVNADYIIELESGISEVARGAMYLPLLQLLGFYHSISKGLNPDKPTNLSSVVYL